jgi:hypothetical protein
MSLKTCALVGVAIVAELLFMALFLASLSMSMTMSTASRTPEVRTTGRPGAFRHRGCRRAESASRPRDVVQKIASMRAMHAQMSEASAMSGVGSAEAVAVLLPEQERLMQEGLGLMRRMKPGLPAAAITDLGQALSADITAAQTESVRDFMELMEALIVMKGDRDSVIEAQRARDASPGPAPEAPNPRRLT